MLNILKFALMKLLQEITYSNGIKSGIYISWNSDNYKVVEGEYLKDEKHGTWTLWYDDGTMKGKENYSNGEMDGQWTWFVVMDLLQNQL